MAIHTEAPVVVYPYKHTSSSELIWSLKSLQNLDHSGVLVVGDPHVAVAVTKYSNPSKPFWTAYSSSHDQIAKYYHACNLETADELILMNDDFFILEPWQAQNYNRGTLADHIKERRKDDSYTRSLKHTESYLAAREMSTLSFELHVPMLVNREKFKHAIEELIPYISKSRYNTVLVRSYYGNRFKIASTYTQDVKNPATPEGMPLISTSEKTFAKSLGQYIKGKL